ncbi:hypothetical protein EDD86DRAFT_188188 [Gorgonomyces haynaldii]|nr:hypothetical protein EDD86DRAFT_188188 [Gorgonomyces haynaldii]
MTFSISISPLVLFSVLDRHSRREENQDYVIGVLLGARGESPKINIVDSFALKFSFQDEQMVLDTDSLNQMYNLHQRVQQNETIVGWYSTCPGLQAWCAWVNDFFKSETDPEEPVYLNIKPQELDKAEEFPMSVYQSVPFSTDIGTLFTPVQAQIEKDGLDYDVTVLRVQLQRCLDLISKLKGYVESVVKDATKGNGAFGQLIMDSLALIPRIDANEFKSIFSKHHMDLQLVSELASLTKNQLEVVDRLQKML